MQNDEKDQQFAERQREKLVGLREELVRIREGMAADEQDLGEAEGDTTPDSGDMSQDMFTREMDASIGEQAERRLGEIDRALQKIEDGTYGLSDDSGEPIPRGRLEAVPEAIRTVEEQQRFERERRPPV
ncbi:MAG: TraR/DksA C4-type zinc finger protein [Actinomycetota bacterium]|jgi:DnaK suppressor protein|nr:TraR/DksA C4-type zinc finger protein [Rubrobacteraceae bacterium]MBA3702970.1 TraR/DksA C4-type zinc finger protein [Rubrobacteraceae bacterium]MDQ3496603.1 TraR/DksA C4-type zinc finger protein [Actinomycetota bacterium]